MTTRSIDSAAACLVMLAALAASGCAVRTPADGARLTLAPRDRDVGAVELAWPDRPQRIIPLELHAGGEVFELADLGPRSAGHAYELMLRETGLGTLDGRTVPLAIGPQSGIWFSARLRPDPVQVAQAIERTGPWPPLSTGMLIFTSEGISTVTLPDGTVRLIPPLGIDPSVIYIEVPEGVALRGTLLAMASLNGMTRGEIALMDEMRSRGWVTVWTSAALGPLSRPGGTNFAAETRATLVTAIAATIQGILAERAYAMEAACDVAWERMPALRELPVIAVGCSAGAICLPPLVARMPGTVDAAVLVGGGADFLEIVSTSSLLESRVTATLGKRRLQGRELRAVGAEVLERVTLDPYHTAACLRGTPVLMLHAMFDRIVPARTGEVLYERLGRPERWSFPTGHLVLFGILPGQSRAIADWAERAAATSGE